MKKYLMLYYIQVRSVGEFATSIEDVAYTLRGTYFEWEGEFFLVVNPYWVRAEDLHHVLPIYGWKKLGFLKIPNSSFSA